MSLRSISAELAAQGFLNEDGRPFAAASVKAMLGGRTSSSPTRSSRLRGHLSGMS